MLLFPMRVMLSKRSGLLTWPRFILTPAAGCLGGRPPGRRCSWQQHVLGRLERKRYPYVLVGMFWYFGTLVPVIGLVQVGSQAMADRYTYIPLTGIFIIVAWGVPELLPKWRRRKIWLAITATVLLTILMVITWKQIRYWENNVVLFTHDVKVTQKNSFAHYVLGLSLEQEGKIDEAMFHYSRSLHIYPEYEVFFKMGYILYQQGKLDEAMVHFKESILRNPNSDEAHNNMGIIRALQGDVNGAIGHYHAAVKINPKHAGAYYNLGRIAANQKKPAKPLIITGKHCASNRI